MCIIYLHQTTEGINSMKYKLSLSDAVQVKLTKLGYEVLDNYLGKARDYIGDDFMPTPQADENGLHSFKFWFLIKLYGDKLLDGNQYFENFEVVINKDNLEDFNV